MKRTIIILTALLFAFSSFAIIGCGKKEEPTPPAIQIQPAKTPAPPVAIKTPEPPAPAEIKIKPAENKKPGEPKKPGKLKLKKKN